MFSNEERIVAQKRDELRGSKFRYRKSLSPFARRVSRCLGTPFRGQTACHSKPPPHRPFRKARSTSPVFTVGG